MTDEKRADGPDPQPHEDDALASWFRQSDDDEPAEPGAGDPPAGPVDPGASTQLIPAAPDAALTEVIAQPGATAPTEMIKPVPHSDLRERPGATAQPGATAPTEVIKPVAHSDMRERPGSAPRGTAARSWAAPPSPKPAAPHTVYPPDERYDDFKEYDYGGSTMRGSGKPRRGMMVAIGLVVVAMIVAGLGLTGVVKIPGLSPKPTPTVGFAPTGTDAVANATQTGSAFLSAWQNGNLKAAANITDDPVKALAALTAYKSDLKMSGLTLSPGTASTAGWLTYSVTAQVGTPASAWTYSSGLAAYQGSADGVSRWFVKWAPSVLFTSLATGQSLALGSIAATATNVVDSNGTALSSSNAPSLTNIITSLEKSAPLTDGTPGQEVEIHNAAGALVSKVAKVSDPVNTGVVKTTIDLTIQQAAQSAVMFKPNSSMVVLQPSTGNILAIANNPPTGVDTAMVGKLAPGSTFKTITSTMLLNKGLVTNLDQVVPCPKTLTVDGLVLHNSGEESGTDYSYLSDFAQSCNNAFSSFYNQVTGTDLTTTAQEYYGFNEPWDVGLGQPTVYGSVPLAQNSELAESLVGQASIAVSPLAMASVAATIDTGTFHQPILVPGTKQLTATPLSAGTDANLKTLMRSVVTIGTLYPVFAGESGLYGKTGTAEVQNEPSNSWVIVFKGDLAVGGLGVGGNFGAQTAGPEIKQMLAAIS